MRHGEHRQLVHGTAFGIMMNAISNVDELNSNISAWEHITARSFSSYDRAGPEMCFRWFLVLKCQRCLPIHLYGQRRTRWSGKYDEHPLHQSDPLIIAENEGLKRISLSSLDPHTQHHFRTIPALFVAFLSHLFQILFIPSCNYQVCPFDGHLEGSSCTYSRTST